MAGRRAAARWAMPAALLLAALGSGCASHAPGPGYYWQSVTGHLRLMAAARPIDDWLADPATPAPLRPRLEQVREMREFAVQELGLPDNASYHRYADLGRRAAVFNVVAAPKFSLQLEQWCFPVAGCVTYRGYFDEADARAFAASLPPELEVQVQPVPAYSTLGWMNWAGGDPVLNTFIHYPEGEVARLLFHELAHQVVYAADDTPFNESFATAVERLGGERWMATRASEAARAEYAAFDRRRREFRALTRDIRQQLQQVYADTALDDAERQARKTAVMDSLRQRYAALRGQWGGWPGYDAWVARANNAGLGGQAAYDDLVPGFLVLFEQQGSNWTRFYDAVRQLARQPKAERRAALQQLMQGRVALNAADDGPP